MPPKFKAKKVYTPRSIYDSKAEYKLNVAYPELKHHPDMRVEYTISHVYRPDFVAPDGTLVEVKGYFPGDERSKFKALKKQHPELDIVLVFCDPNEKISETSRTTYKDWALKNGFKAYGMHDFPGEKYGCAIL